MSYVSSGPLQVARSRFLVHGSQRFSACQISTLPHTSPSHSPHPPIFLFDLWILGYCCIWLHALPPCNLYNGWRGAVMKAGQCLLFSTHTTYKTQGGCAPQHYRKFFSDARSVATSAGGSGDRQRQRPRQSSQWSSLLGDTGNGRQLQSVAGYRWPLFGRMLCA